MADSIFPNYVRQNADGTVGAVFSGGVELNSSDSSKNQPPASENSIQWVRQQDGALIAQIYSSVEEPGNIAGDSQFQQQVFDPDGRGAQLYLSAQPDQNTPNRGAAVSISSGSTGNVGQVSVNAWDANGNESNAHVLKGDGSSDFARSGLGVATTSNENASGAFGAGGWYGVQSAGLTVKNPKGASILGIASLSAYSSVAGNEVQIALGLDNVPAQQVGVYYFNAANDHRAFPVVAWKSPVVTGTHSMEVFIYVSQSTVYVNNTYDSSCVIAIECP